MRKNFLIGLLAITVFITIGNLTARAFPLSKFTYNSKLSTGRWVKIAVAADGMYQITTEELAEMGFSDPSHVQIYGQGGHAINEYLKGDHIDDLTAVPMMLHEGKIIFYGQGPVGKVMLNHNTTTPYYDRTRNHYANKGYYFITDASPEGVAQQSETTPGSNWIFDSYAMYLHETEKLSIGETGKSLLGESLLPDGFTIDYMLPYRSHKTLTVHLAAAEHCKSYVSYLSASITSDSVTEELMFSAADNKFDAVSKEDHQRHYNYVTPTQSTKSLTDTCAAGQLKVWIYNPWNVGITLAHLDYATITYRHANRYEEGKSSFTMGFPHLAADAQVVMSEVGTETVVWNITDPQQVTQMYLTPVVDDYGEVSGMGFTPGASEGPCEFVAFNPSLPLNSIDSYSEVSNQNLHGLSTPDMLIVTNDYFMPEAERLAQMHRDHDGMTVHVVDQQQIFNEFSSGTPDAMGIRLFSKMLYDRNSNKFKTLLMFGPATYDFRGITTSKPHSVIWFETDKGDSEEDSYGTDDFFGFLNDNTGDEEFQYMRLNLGIGRIPCVDLAQAHQSVDKIIHYVLNPDYGVWRNHYTVWADGVLTTYDTDLHALQAEGIDNLIQESLKIPMVADKAYVEMFPLNGNMANEARRHVVEMLGNGQFYGTYVGHASTKSLTSHRMWTAADVRAQNYTHQPIFMTACCDVARIDGNDQGIAEMLFHQPNGGAIALLTSSREVEAIRNDYLNQTFAQSLFNYNTTHTMGTTLGEAYRNSKIALLNLNKVVNTNKMSFLLLGDPAIKVEYPKPLFNVTSINGVDIANDTVELAPLQQVTVEADVMNTDMQTVNTAFNGDATLSIYDAKRLLKCGLFQGNSLTISGDLYYPRELLTEVQGRVVDGHFVGTAVLPRYFKAVPGEDLAIHIYAHRDSSSDMVNGVTTHVLAKVYDPSTAVLDEAGPTIEAMYLNEQNSFDQGVPVATTSTLHAIARDDVSFNNQAVGIGTSASLTLDNGSTNYAQLKDFLTIGEGGKTLQIHFPITGLTPGPHSLTLSVQDVAGNVAMRTIDFMVAGESTLSLLSSDLVAIDQAHIDLESSDLATLPAMTLKVVNNRGQLVWSTTTSTLPTAWDLTDQQGQRVAPGLYRLFGQYHDGAVYGGTNILPIIVMDPVIRSDQ